MGNVVEFYKGLSSALPESALRSEDALYFTTDTHRIYVGSHEYSYYLAGSGIAVTGGNTIGIKGFKSGDIAEITAVKPTPKLLNVDDLGDVSVTSPTDGQTLVYDAVSEQWVNGYLPVWTTF